MKSYLEERIKYYDEELVMEEIFKTLAKEMPNSQDKEVIA